MRAAGLNLIVARLTRVSAWAVAGVRAAGPSLGHFIFQREDLLLDLQFRAKDDSVFLLGQILDAADQGARYGHSEVKLMSEADMVAQTATNEFGEFEMQYALQPNLLLVIELEGKTYLVTPLPHPSEI
jgi:hypothetical protein